MNFTKIFVAQTIDTKYLFGGTEEANSVLAVIIMIAGIILFGVYVAINAIKAEEQSTSGKDEKGGEDNDAGN